MFNNIATRTGIDVKTIKTSCTIVAVTMLFLVLFGYNITLLGNSYDGLVWRYKLSNFHITDYSMDWMYQTHGREESASTGASKGYENLYHLAVLLHIAYGVLLFAPFKKSMGLLKELKEKSIINKDEYKQAVWATIIGVAFVLNVLLLLHEGYFTFLTDVVEFAAPQFYNAKLHTESVFYLDGRGWLFVVLTAIYPALIYLNRKTMQ